MSRARARPRRAFSWATRHRVVLATGVVAASPVIVSVVRALAWRWYPVSDDGTIATRAYDVFSAHSPLVGQFSQASHLTGHATYSPGPLLYWLLAIPARLGPSALVIAVGLVNVVAVMGAVGLAKRRGGPALMLATALGVALMCHSLGAERLHDIWNPYVATLPMLLLVFASWSIACGEHRLLPLAVLVGSFAAQAHVAFVFPVGGVLAASLVLLGRRHREMGRARRRVAVRRSLAAAMLVGIACWSAPLAEQMTHRPGNLVAIVQAGTSRHPTLGFAVGWHAVVRTVSIPPWWLHGSAGARRVHELSGASIVATLTAILAIAGLVAAAMEGRRRRSEELLAGAVIGLVLCIAVGTVAGTTPGGAYLWISLTYTLWWASPVGLLVWLTVGWWAIGRLRWPGVTVAARRRGLTLASFGAPRAAAVGAAALVLAAVFASIDQHADPARPLERSATALAARVTSALPGGASIRVDANPTAIALSLQSGLIYALRREGLDVASGAFLAEGLGPSYLSRPRYDHLVRLHDAEPAGPEERVLARVPVGAVPVTVRLDAGFKGLVLRFPAWAPTPAGAAPRIVTLGLTGAATG